eukprot:CAMPEP_0174333024 /NCGR_PEP_ID=MMETSP0810-20121108/18779_1 /TAXON_ID=73025 ORGANISM="Eutreptiella gymnastica-like, Strain CCMP1594" /NCGR_SAMPLE_ID=MMETSP0810 /ASSEMBLY_ACC=CAM_ASM_000659 /LENGTH=30 /DNA_ID= /DNA_START= /DNA_END= /DNA_ORIENTATION=
MQPNVCQALGVNSWEMPEVARHALLAGPEV